MSLQKKRGFLWADRIRDGEGEQRDLDSEGGTPCVLIVEARSQGRVSTTLSLGRQDCTTLADEVFNK